MITHAAHLPILQQHVLNHLHCHAYTLHRSSYTLIATVKYSPSRSVQIIMSFAPVHCYTSLAARQASGAKWAGTNYSHRLSAKSRHTGCGATRCEGNGIYPRGCIVPTGSLRIAPFQILPECVPELRMKTATITMVAFQCYRNVYSPANSKSVFGHVCSRQNLVWMTCHNGCGALAATQAVLACQKTKQLRYDSLMLKTNALVAPLLSAE